MSTPFDPPTLNLHLQESTVKDGITQSELALLDECPKKWNLRYNNLLKRRDSFYWPLAVGDAWHHWQENWRRGKCNVDDYPKFDIPKDLTRDSDFEERLDYWTEILPQYQIEYAKLRAGEEKEKYDLIENTLIVPYHGFDMMGKIDLASSKNWFIRDFKTTGSSWFISQDGWHFKLQFMMYSWLISRTFPKTWGKRQFSFQLDMMQKPALKQTQKETFPQHINRVKADIVSRPEFYLSIESFLITQDMVRHFEENVLKPKLERLSLVRSMPKDSISIITNMNTNTCNLFGNRCEFFEVCEKGWDAGKFFFEKREVKHVEL